MANEVRIGLTVTSNGTTEAETKKAKALKAAYDDAARSAAGVGGGTAGSRAAASMATRGAAGAGSQEYGQLRGTAGVTGASARDFANQAQGLGGLVRVYATFAANLFAVSAAFNALREAAQTQQLIRGLDQLGAQSGRALGALSKELVNATGGAISLRESMTAVAQASSAGLANEQIKQLAIVANQASQALGLNMADALNRLSRGISKIEPELLDELGIFVRVDRAVQDYALALGKSASSLSEFERRQAFANAVLEQGQKKFGAIAAEANPFDKLLASIKDLALQGLTLVNKVLEPIIRLLAESPSALVAVFASIGVLLLKQALPALGQFRAGLRASAEDAANAAKGFKESFGDAFQGALEARFDIPKLERELARLQTAFAKTAQPTTLSAATSKNIGTLRGDDEAEAIRAAAVLNETLTRKTKIVETGMKGRKQASEAEINAAKQEIQYIKLAIAEYQKYIQLRAAQAAAQGVADKPPGRFDPEVVAAKTYATLQTRVDKSTAVANAAAAANVAGIRGAMTLLNKEIEEKGIKGFDKLTTQVRGGAAAIVSRISGISAAFANVGIAVAAVGAVYEAFDMLASNATKEQEEFNTALEQTASNVQAANKTVEEYTRRSKEGFSSQGIVALATALSGISTNLDVQLASLQKWEAASNVWDRIKDKIAGAFGKSNLDQVKKNTVSTVEAIVKTLQFTSLGGDAKRRLANVLSISPEALGNVKTLTSAIQNLDEQQLAGLSDEIKGISEDLTKATQSVQAFKESLQASGKAIDQIAQSTQFTDLQGKLGVELLQAADKLGNALRDDVLGALTAIADLSKDPKALAAAGFSTEEINRLFKASQIQQDINIIQQNILASEQKLEKLRKERTTTRDADQFGATPEELSGAAERIVTAIEAAENAAEDAQTAIINRSKRTLEALKTQAAEFAQTQTDLVEKLADAGLKRVEIALKGAVQKARLSVQEFQVGEQKAAGLDVAAQDRDIAIARANIEKQQAVAAFNAQKAVEENTDAITRLTASMNALALEQQRQREKELKGASFTESDNRRFDDLIARQLRIAATAAVKEQLREGTRPESVRGALVAAPTATQPGRMIDVTADAQRQLGRERQAREMQLQAAVAGPESQIQIANLKYVNESLRYQEKLQQELAKLDEQRAQLGKEILQTFVGFTQQNTLAENSAVELAQKEEIRRQAAAQLLAIRQKEAEILRIVTPATQASAQQQIDLLYSQRQQVEATKDLRLLQTELERLTKDQATQTNQIVKRQANVNAILEQQLSIVQNIKKISREDLDSRLQLGDVGQRLLVTLKTQRDLEDEALRFQQERRKLLDDIELKEKALADARAKRQAVDRTLAPFMESEGPVPQDLMAASAAATAGETEAQRQLELQKGALNTLTQINAQNVQSITNQGLLNEKLAVTKDLLTTIKGLSETLSTVFGDFGTKLGNAITTIATAFDSAQRGSIATEAALKNIDARIAEIGSNIDSLPDPEGQDKGAYQKLMKERNSLDRDREKSIVRQRDLEVASAAKSIGAVKSLFKEKTAGYKILDKTEKALHLFRMGAMVAETAMEIKSAFTSVTTSGTKIGAKTAEAGVDGVAGIIKAFSSLPFPASLVAGAAMAAIMATLLSSIGGKSPAIPAGVSAADQQKVQGTGQTYVDGKLVQREGGVLGDDTAKADSIVSSVEMLSKEFYGLLGSGSSKIVQALENIKKNTEDTVKALLTSGTFGAQGFAADFGTAEFRKSNFGGIFGSSSQEIVNSGIKVIGTLDGLAKSLGQFQIFETVKTSSRGWLWGLFGSSSKLSENVKDLKEKSPEAVEALARVFDSMGTVLIESVTALEGPNSALVQAIKNIPIELNVSLKDLKPQEAIDALLAELSVKLNRGAAVVLPFIKQYQRVGEEFFETVARIVKDSEVLNDGLFLLGQTVSGFADTVSKVEFEQNLLELLGGVEKAATKFESYFENFLTPQEKFRVKFLQLTKTFTDAQRTLPQTKEEFVKLFNTLDYVNSEEDRKTFALLLNNTDRFNDLLSLQSEITKKNTEDFEALKKSLSQFRASLLIGSTSVLSPTERYALARAEFEATRQKALEDKDPEALKKLQESSQTFLGLSRELYASGSQYVSDFNSVLKVLDDASKLDITQVNYAAEQLKATNDSLGVLQNIERILAVEAAKKTTPTTPPRSEATDVMDPDDWREVTSLGGGGKLLFSESTGRYRIDPNAMGGFAHGLSLVGEEGPELVDFKTPGRVYTAEQTQGMFTPRVGTNAFQAVVTQLQSVQEELVQLRKEQQKQTGDMIVTNYDAQQKVAEEIVDAVMKSVQEKSWQEKNKPTIN